MAEEQKIISLVYSAKNLQKPTLTSFHRLEMVEKKFLQKGFD